MLNAFENQCARGHAVQAFVFAAVVVLWGFSFFIPGCDLPMRPAHAHAQDVDQATLLARVCHAEADGSAADCSAIHHVIERRAKRAGVSYEAMAHSYSAVDRSGRVPTDRQLTRGRRIAARVISGAIPDACPGSTQWGGMRLARDRSQAEHAVKAGRWVMVMCRRPTANTFFREVRR